MGTPEQDSYLARVFGIDPRAGRAGAGTEALLPIWIAARDAANGQLAAMAQALRKLDFPLAQVVADKGIGALTGRLQVGLHVALAEFDAAKPEQRDKLAARIQVRTEALRRFVAEHRGIERMEHNPFGVPFAMRSVLLP